MDTFEYKTYTPDMKRGFLKKSFDGEALQDDLVALGKDGWDLCATIPISGNAGVASYGSSTAQVIFIFKRKIL